jgi:hypothetical protein
VEQVASSAAPDRNPWVAERGGVPKRAPYQQSPICTTSPEEEEEEEEEEEDEAEVMRFTATRFLHKVA